MEESKNEHDVVRLSGGKAMGIAKHVVARRFHASRLCDWCADWIGLRLKPLGHGVGMLGVWPEEVDERCKRGIHKK